MSKLLFFLLLVPLVLFADDIPVANGQQVYTYLTFSDPAHLARVLNAVAMLSNDSTFKATMAFFSGAGIIYSSYIVMKEPEKVIKLAVGTVVIAFLSLYAVFSKSTVIVKDDRANVNLYVDGNYQSQIAVANVPFGLAASLYYPNAFSVWLTHAFEDVLSTDADDTALMMSKVGFGKQLNILQNAITKPTINDMDPNYAYSARVYMQECVADYLKADPSLRDKLSKTSSIIQDLSPNSLGGSGNEGDVVWVEGADANSSIKTKKTGTCGELYAYLYTNYSSQSQTLGNLYNSGVLKIDNTITSAINKYGFGDANSLWYTSLGNIALAKTLDAQFTAMETGLSSSATQSVSSTISQLAIQQQGIGIGKFLNDVIPLNIMLIELVIIMLFPVAMLIAILIQNHLAPLNFFLTIVALELVNPSLALTQYIVDNSLASNILDMYSTTTAANSSLYALSPYYNELLTMSGTSGMLAAAIIGITTTVIFTGGNMAAASLATGVANAYKNAEEAGKKSAELAGQEQSRELLGKSGRERYSAEYKAGFDNFGRVAGGHEMWHNDNLMSQPDAKELAVAKYQSEMREARASMAQTMKDPVNDLKAIEASSAKQFNDQLAGGQGVLQSKQFDASTNQMSNDYKQGVVNQAASSINQTSTAGAGVSTDEAISSGQFAGLNEASKTKAGAKALNALATPTNAAEAREFLRNLGNHISLAEATQMAAQIKASFEKSDIIEQNGGVDKTSSNLGSGEAAKFSKELNEIQTATDEAHKKGVTLAQVATLEGIKAGTSRIGDFNATVANMQKYGQNAYGIMSESQGLNQAASAMASIKQAGGLGALADLQATQAAASIAGTQGSISGAGGAAGFIRQAHESALAQSLSQAKVLGWVGGGAKLGDLQGRSQINSLDKTNTMLDTQSTGADAVLNKDGSYNEVGKSALGVQAAEQMGALAALAQKYDINHQNNLAKAVADGAMARGEQMGLTEKQKYDFANNELKSKGLNAEMTKDGLIFRGASIPLAVAAAFGRDEQLQYGGMMGVSLSDGSNLKMSGGSGGGVQFRGLESGALTHGGRQDQMSYGFKADGSIIDTAVSKIFGSGENAVKALEIGTGALIAGGLAYKSGLFGKVGDKFGDWRKARAPKSEIETAALNNEHSIVKGKGGQQFDPRNIADVEDFMKSHSGAKSNLPVEHQNRVSAMQREIEANRPKYVEVAPMEKNTFGRYPNMTLAQTKAYDAQVLAEAEAHAAAIEAARPKIATSFRGHEEIEAARNGVANHAALLEGVSSRATISNHTVIPKEKASGSAAASAVSSNHAAMSQSGSTASHASKAPMQQVEPWMRAENMGEKEITAAKKSYEIWKEENSWRVAKGPLNEEQLAHARSDFEQWRATRPKNANGKEFSFENYVDYVQKKSGFSGYVDYVRGNAKKLAVGAAAGATLVGTSAMADDFNSHETKSSVGDTLQTGGLLAGLGAAGAGAISWAGSKAGLIAEDTAKLVGRHLPGVGIAAGTAISAGQFANGDKVGGTMTAVSTAASQVPVVGTVVSLAIDAAQLGMNATGLMEKANAAVSNQKSIMSNVQPSPAEQMAKINNNIQKQSSTSSIEAIQTREAFDESIQKVANKDENVDKKGNKPSKS